MTDKANTEYTIRHEVVMATPAQCYAVALDLAAYPEWIGSLAEVTVDSTDEDGRPEVATFVAVGMGRSTRYQLRYDLSGAPSTIRWSLVEGDIMETLDGAYTFRESEDFPGATDVTYELTVDPTLSIPGFVKRRAEGKLIDSALPKFKERVEGQFG